MKAARLRDHDDAPREDGIVRLHEVSWDDYQRLLEIRGDHSAPRFTYFEGELEITSPSRHHESLKSVIGCLVEVWCLERDVDFSTYGSWTLEDKAAKLGIEPDECYVFGQVAEPLRPDLAIEVVWTSGGINKLELYKKLGVGEVWYWRRGHIQPYVLDGGEYRAVDSSQKLPGIDLEQLASFLDEPTTSAAIKAYRAALATP